MDRDRFGFDEPPGFEVYDEDPKPSGRRITPARLLLLATVMLVALFVTCLANLDEKQRRDLLGNIGPLRQHARNAKIRAAFERFANHHRAGDLEKALEEANHLTSLHPPFAIFRADILGQMGRYREAVNEYTQLIAREPGNATAYNNRAYNRALGRFELEEAMQDINRAMEIEGDRAAFIDTRAYLHYLLGKPEVALVELDGILESGVAANEFEGPGLGEIYFHRGLVLRSLNRSDAAKKDFDRAARLGFKMPEFPEPLVQPKAVEPPREQPKRPAKVRVESV